MLLSTLLLGCTAPAPLAESQAPITVFAASSLTDVLPRVGAAWTARTGNRVTFVFDASSRLARQLEGGAEADLFLSADERWLDDAQERALVRPETRRALLGNTLVLVVPSGSKFVPENATALADPRVEHLALAGENVPAGRYARAALASLGVLETVAPRVVDSDSVRTALGWVASGDAQAGVVYGTDAASEPGVALAFTFPSDSHPRIVYPGAVTTSSAQPDEAEAFLAFCSTDGRALFEAAGFAVLQ